MWEAILPFCQENESWVIQLCCSPMDLAIEVNRDISKGHDKDMKNVLVSAGQSLTSVDNVIYRLGCSGVRKGDTCL